MVMALDYERLTHHLDECLTYKTKITKINVGQYVEKTLITSKLKKFQTSISKYFMPCAELKPEVYQT